MPGSKVGTGVSIVKEFQEARHETIGVDLKPPAWGGRYYLAVASIHRKGHTGFMSSEKAKKPLAWQPKYSWRGIQHEADENRTKSVK